MGSGPFWRIATPDTAPDIACSASRAPAPAAISSVDCRTTVRDVPYAAHRWKELPAQEAVLQAQATELDRSDALLTPLKSSLDSSPQGLPRKRGTIRQLANALQAHRRARSNPHLIRALREYLGCRQWILAPRLGRLKHYPPRALRVESAPLTTDPNHQLPSICVVTPSFEQQAFIERTMLSVLEQHYPRLDYRVQDGGSKDGTVDLLKRFQDRLSAWASAPDTGQAQAINRGFRAATGEIMAWLNSDDVFMPGTLARVGEYFAQHPEVDVVYGHRILIDKQDREIGRWVLPPHDDAILSWVDFVPQETLFWRRRIWDKVGGQVDESFQFALDWDLLVRFREAGARMVRVPHFLGGFRVHEAQKTSARMHVTGLTEMNRIRTRIHGHVPPDRRVRCAVAPYILRHLLHDLSFRLGRRWARREREMPKAPGLAPDQTAPDRGKP